MAPMVAATFSYFHWSSCSGKQHNYANCLEFRPVRELGFILLQLC